MTTTLKDRLLSELDRVQGQARALMEKEDRDDATEANLAALLAEGKKIQARADELVAIESLSAPRGALAALQRPDQPQGERQMTAGEEFTRSDVFTNYAGRGTSSRYQTRALPMGITTPFGAVLDKTRIDNSSPNPVTPLTDLIPSIQVATNSIELVVLTKTSGGAAVVLEGSNKPPVEWAPSAVPVTLDTIAAYTQATRQLLEDSQAIRSMIDTELQREVAIKLESEAAAALVAATLPTATAATLLESIRVGIGTVQAAGYSPNAVLLNPADWATLDITVLGATLLGPSVGSQFWGVRPVASTAQPAGTATVGDFSAGASRFTRTGISLYITDSHASTFIANIFTILAEARAKTVIRRPAAFVECTKTP